MDRQVESIEEMLKPTKRHRGLFLSCFFCLVVVQILVSFQLKNISIAFNVLHNGAKEWVVNYSMIVLVLRFIVLFMSLFGLFHVRITPWTISSTTSFVAYVISIILRLYFLIYAPGKWFISLSLLAYEVSMNAVSILLSLVFAYHSVYVHSESKVSLEIEDPQRVFTERLVKSVFSIFPGAGFFRESLMKLAKIE